jgi:uncharacterized protein YciI
MRSAVIGDGQLPKGRIGVRIILPPPGGAQCTIPHGPGRTHAALRLHRPRRDAEGRIRHAGPLLDAAGEPLGSLILFEAESLDAARTLAARDPYVVEGIFERHEVHETRVVFPR